MRQFRDCVAFQDRGVYDLAADEWEKFLKQFLRDRLAAKAHHYLGLCRLLLNNTTRPRPLSNTRSPRIRSPN